VIADRALVLTRGFEVSSEILRYRGPIGLARGILQDERHLPMEVLPLRGDQVVEQRVAEECVTKLIARLVARTLPDELCAEPGAERRDDCRAGGAADSLEKVEREPLPDDCRAREDPARVRIHQRETFADARADGCRQRDLAKRSR
jgi:hypothetical protein